MTKLATLRYLSMLSLLAACSVYAQGPAAGVEVVNQASVSYTDPNGEDQLVTTNEVVLVIQQVYSATIERDRIGSAKPGGTVRFLHTLTNTGNGLDRYQIELADNNANGGDNGDFVNIKVFHDRNHNGQVDAGEPLLADGGNVGSLNLQADEVASLVVLAQIPNTAADGNVFDLTLTAEAYEGGNSPVIDAVTDLTAGGGVDGQDDSNEDRVLVTSDAVLVTSKSSVYELGNPTDPSDDAIVYTVTVSNRGLTDAQDIAVTDALPAEVVFDAGTAVSSSDAAAFDAPTAGLDDGLNGQAGTVPAHDGGTPGNMLGEIDVLAVDASVDFSFRVLVAAGTPAGTEINNTVIVQGDVDGDGNTDDPVESNQTVDLVPGTYGVRIEDTGTVIAFDPAGGATSPAINDGSDDDAANDIQLVDIVPQGSDVIFTNVVTNLGNGNDIFNLTVESTGFPAGTVFQFFAGDGLTPLLDSNSDGIPDTGVLSSFAVTGEQRAIVVRAQLPRDAIVNTPVDAVVRATSSADVSSPASFDVVTERLGATDTALVDIANSDTATGLGDPLVDADPATAITTTLNGAAGGFVVFDLFLVNEGKNADSYDLGAYADAAGTSVLPDWMTVSFRTLDGVTISSADSIQPAAQFAYQAVVALSASAPTAITQSMYFQAASPTSTAKNSKQDAVVVTAREQISLVADQTGTVEACNGVTYRHTVTNSGDSQEDIVIAVTSQSSLSHVLLFPTAVNAGEPSAFKLAQTLAVGSNVAVFEAATGSWITRALVSDGASGFAIDTNPGDYSIFDITVNAGCEVALTTQDQLVVNASVVSGTASVSNTDITTVGSVSLKLNKLGALDQNCDGVADTAFLTAQVNAAPQECVIWQLTAENTGPKTACNVQLKDAATAFTNLAAGSALVFSEPAPGTGVCVEAAPSIQCSVGNSIDINNQAPNETFCMRPGETAVVRFRVILE